MRIMLIFFLILLAALGYLASLNPGYTTIHLTTGVPIEIPTIALVLLSLAAGGLLVLVALVLSGTWNVLRSWRILRRERQHARIQDLHVAAVNAALGRHHKEAIHLFRKILDLNPDDTRALLRLGDLYRAEGDSLQALRFHRRARTVDEKNLETIMAIAQDLEEGLRYEEAAQTLQDLLKADSDNTTAITRLRDLWLRLERWEPAHDLTEKILKGALRPQEHTREQALLVGIKYELGRMRQAQGHGEEARRFFKSILKLDKGFIPAHLGLGETLIKDGKTKNACELWEKAYETTTGLVLLRRLEDLYVELGEPERIIALYRRALERRATDPLLILHLGKLYQRLEMLDEAVDVLSSLEVPDGRFPDLHRLLGSLYLRQNNVSAALEQFTRGTQTDLPVLPYRCTGCEHQASEWTGRCPRCKRWNTFQVTPLDPAEVRFGSIRRQSA